MPEGRNYTQSKVLNTPASSGSSVHTHPNASQDLLASSSPNDKPIEKKISTVSNSYKMTLPSVPIDLEKPTKPETRRAKLNVFFLYFSEWHHLKTPFGTTSCPAGSY
jgi:hypothetical protein